MSDERNVKMTETNREKWLESALEFMLLAWDSDAGYRHHCGVGDDVSFPAYRGLIRSVEAARKCLPKPTPITEGEK